MLFQAIDDGTTYTLDQRAGETDQLIVAVGELMPPAVRTDMTSEFDEAGISTISTDELVKQTFAALRAGKTEIRPGQSNQAALMRRLAPNFINRQLWKASKPLVPATAS